MRILRRDSTTFEYLAYLRKEEVLRNGLHTGNTKAVYDDPVQYRGDISIPSGAVSDNLFGINTQYTHVLLMDNPDADIREEGLIVWKGCEYDIQAVRPSMNVLAVALKKRTVNHAPEDWRPTGQTGATGATGATGSTGGE